MSTVAVEGVDVEELTGDAARQVFEEHCREELGVSGDEFLKVYESGQLPDQWPAEAVCRLEMLLPLVQ